MCSPLRAILGTIHPVGAQSPDSVRAGLLGNYWGSRVFRRRLAVRVPLAQMAVVSSFLIFLSCRHSENAQALGTTAQVARAVEMMRLSSNHDKHLWLARLETLTCRSADVCQLKEACTNAYREHLRALDMIDLARQRMQILAEDSSVPDASAESMLESAMLAQNAQKLLGKTRISMRRCAENEAVIRQRYGIR